MNISLNSAGGQMQRKQQEKAAAARRWQVIATCLMLTMVLAVSLNNSKYNAVMRSYLRNLSENTGSDTASNCSCSQEQPQQEQQQHGQRLQKDFDTSTHSMDLTSAAAPAFDTLPRARKIFFPETIPTPPTLHTVKEYTDPRYEKHMTNVPGREHYALLYYLSSTYGDERPIIDIGTRYAASALAFAAGGSAVKTFDLPTSRERTSAFRGKSEFQWQSEIQAKGLNITFYNVNLMEVPSLEETLGSAWLISLDTAHLPDTVPFEREWFQRLVQTGYKGLLLLDDIHLNPQMQKWWKELQDGAKKDGYRTFDLTKIGHFSGTGLVDFSGRAVVQVQVPQPQVSR